MRKLPFSTFLALVLLIPASGAAVAQQPVPRITIGQGEYAFVPQLCQRLGVQMDWNPTTGVCVLRQEGRMVEGRLTSSRWLMNGRFVFGTAALAEYQGVPVLPVADVKLILEGVLGRGMTEREVAALFGAGEPVLTPSAAPAAPPTLQSVRTIPYPRYTRIVLTFDTPIEYSVERDGDRRIRVVLPGAVIGAGTGPLTINNDVVETVGWRKTGSGAQVTVATAQPMADYEAYYLEDPVRLILDFRREAEAAPLVLVPGVGGTPVAPQRPGPEPARAAAATVATVVIDPGHGGRDPGAQGPSGVFEKTITLQIAEKLQARLEEELGLKVLLTRTGDYHVSLAERTQLANTAKEGAPADLFISLHTNSISSVRAGGFEAYFVSEAVEPSAAATAALENAAHWEVAGEGSDADLLRRVLWDLQFAAYVEESKDFAVLVQEHMGRQLTIENRGVKQAPFLVLSGCAMPSVLIEVGFLSNRTEEVILQTPEFQKGVAAAITTAVAEFKARRERRLGLASATHR